MLPGRSAPGRVEEPEGQEQMGHRIVFVAIVIFLSGILPGCGSAAMRGAPFPGAVQEGDPRVQPGAHGDSHHGHGHRLEDGDAASAAPRIVRYLAGEGFVPPRVDVETGARVVLVDETNGGLAPMFGGTHADGRHPETAEGDAAAAEPDHERHGHAGPHPRLDHEPAHAAEPDHERHGHAGHHGGAARAWTWEDSTVPGGWQWTHTFDTSGYWRLHNAKAPSHAALVVALPPAGTKLPPLVTSAEPLEFPAPPEMTAEQFAELLGNTGKVREYLEAHGPANTLELLRDGETETGIDCHGAAHRLGRMAFAEHGAAAVLGVDEVCQSGMRHGVMEQLFVSRGITNLAEDVDALCPSADLPYVRHQCLHGVGHGVMAWTAYELEDALGLCERLGDDLSRRSCYSGVFMENVVSGLSGEVGSRSSYVSDVDPHYPCNALPERYVGDCYWYQTSQMLNVFHQDLSRVPEACQEAPPYARRTCFGSWGRDISGAHRGNPYLIAQYCRLAPSLGLQGDCIDGAARTVFWDASQQDAGVALCREVEEPIVGEACWRSIVSQAHSVGTDLAPFCGQLPERWNERCLARP